MLFTFIQRAANGFLFFDEAAGLTAAVVVEADSLEDAIERAQRLGLYFNGVEQGIDRQNHGGDRWRRPLAGMQFGRLSTTLANNILPTMRRCVHWKDGKRTWNP